MADLSQFIKVFGEIKMIAKILTVEPTTGGKGQRVTLEGGEKVYCFQSSFLNLIQPGATVDLALQKQGIYTQVVGVQPAYGAPITTAPQPVTTPPGGMSPAVAIDPSLLPQSVQPAVATPAPGQPVVTTPQPLTAPFDKDSIIMRQAILKSPVLGELFKELTDDTKSIDSVVKLAQRFEKYVVTGE